ncbi:MAG TPA: WhiB family transcriptional regulator [Kribbellaceae bacterium]|nr:WhiB family transcriptional regulator [Kribbellaceae bacterium]
MNPTVPLETHPRARRRKPPAGAVAKAPPRLPAPLWDNWSWQEQAACRDVDPDLFFSVESERGLRRRAREVLAKSLCSTCPVRRQCREHALATGETYGVWGGTTEEERAHAQPA